MGVINLSSKDNNKLNDQIFNNVINLISHAVYIVSKKYNHTTKICLLSISATCFTLTGVKLYN